MADQNENPIARIQGKTLVIGSPTLPLTLSGTELREVMENAAVESGLAPYRSRDALSKVENIRFEGDIHLTGSANALFAGMPSLKSLDDNGHLDMSRVWSTDAMFKGCESLTSPQLNASLATWDLSSVRSAKAMFQDCRSLDNIEVHNMDFSSLQDASEMFMDCRSLKSVDLSGVHAPHLETTASMFEGCWDVRRINMSNLDSHDIQDASSMFQDCHDVFEINMQGMDLSRAKNLESMFSDCYHMIKLDAADTRWPDPKNLDVMTGALFSKCVSLIDVSGPDALKQIMAQNYMDEAAMAIQAKQYENRIRVEGDTLVIGLRPEQPASVLGHMMGKSGNAPVALRTEGQFLAYEIQRECDRNPQITKIDIAGPVVLSDDASFMFSQPMNRIESITGLEMLDTRAVTDMRGMFCGLEYLREADVSHLDTRNVEDMSFMFEDCESLPKIDVTNFDMGEVRGAECMFKGCASLKELDLSNLDVRNLESAGNLCSGCVSLERASLSRWDARSLTDMSGMFMDCPNLVEVDTDDMLAPSVHYLSRAFENCTSLDEIDLRGLTGLAFDVDHTFSGCSALKDINMPNLEMDYSASRSTATLDGCDSLDTYDLTLSMRKELGFQQMAAADCINVDGDQIRPVEGGYAVSFDLREGGRMRTREITVPDRDDRIWDNGDGTLDITIPPIIRLSGTEDGRPVTELISMRDLLVQQDAAWMYEHMGPQQQVEIQAPNLLAEDFEAPSDPAYDEIPF